MPAKILIVDDEVHMQKLINLRFRREISKNEYEFHYALDGQQALNVIDTQPEMDILLLDINMPVIDGLTLLGLLKDKSFLLKTIMVTAYGNMGNIRAAMNGGAFDFVTKPIDFLDLKTTIRKAEDELLRLKAGEAARKQLPLTQRALKETDQKARYLEKLNQFKSRFFTNISHEFRTPLTVIKGMSDQIEEDPSRWLEKGNRMIRRNTNQLLDLVNQILELRKLEAGQLQLRLEQRDLIAFLRYLIESFHSLAESKDLSLSFHSTASELWMDMDPEKILRIISNLFSNAIKFTPAGGQIRLTVDKRQNMEEGNSESSAAITLSDSGTGIPAEQIPHIFDRFYQVDGTSTREGEGTGIGLALVRELLELMEGKIKVESKLGEGASFHLQLPITCKAKKISKPLHPEIPVHLTDFPEEKEEIVPGPGGEQSLPSLLILEDNPDVVEYLVSCLEDQYALLIARDGQDGIDLALEQVPDLIISDVMMPHKDGFEVCNILKQDQRTSHIPIILLTARADDDSRLQGLKRGADAYLAKPFNKAELFIRLEKLLELRRALQARYGGSMSELPSPSAEFEAEDQFILTIRQTLEENLTDADFRVPELCKSLGMSRSNLHRKIKALTGSSTAIFVRRLRLQKALGLLQESDLNISEVAYEVGFSDPRYFSRTFAMEYGYSPKSVRNP